MKSNWGKVYIWTILHCTVSVYSITLYSVCVQYYTVQCLCAVLHCTVSVCSITLYFLQYYTVHIPLAECTTNLSQQDLKSSNYHKIDNNDHKKELRKTNFNKLLRRCERDSNPWIDCINWNRKGRGRRSNLRQKFYEIFQNILTILTF